MTRPKQPAATNTSDNYHHGDLHNALIQAGLAILADEGAASLSLRKVARRAGVSHAAPYRHFADKGELFAAIAGAGFTELGNGVEVVLETYADRPDLIVKEAMWGYVEFALDNPDTLRVMFSDIIRDLDAHPELLETAIGALAKLGQCLTVAQAAGELGPGDLEQGTIAAWAMIHGLAVLMIEQKVPGFDCFDRSAAEPFARRMIDVFVNGLKDGLPA